MATQKETVEFILGKLRHAERFSARPMFGEYALYADGNVVALVCDDRLHVKILPASKELEMQCECVASHIPEPKPILLSKKDNSSPCKIFPPSCLPFPIL